jgi:hypothetical protein
MDLFPAHSRVGRCAGGHPCPPGGGAPPMPHSPRGRRWRCGHGTGSIQNLDADTTRPTVDQLEALRGTIGEVEAASPGERPPIVDAQHDGASVGGVGDAHAASERQRRVRGREAALVERLAARRATAMEAGAVPGSRHELAGTMRLGGRSSRGDRSRTMRRASSPERGEQETEELDPPHACQLCQSAQGIHHPAPGGRELPPSGRGTAGTVPALSELDTQN